MFLIKDPSHFYLCGIACLSVSFPVPLQFLFFKLQATYSCDCNCEHSKCTGINTQAHDSCIYWYTKAWAHTHTLKKRHTGKRQDGSPPHSFAILAKLWECNKSSDGSLTGRNEEPPLLNVYLCIRLYVRTTQALINNTCMLWILVSSLHATATLQNELQPQLSQHFRVF